MATQDDICRTLEDMLGNETGKPLRLSLHFLQSITKDFSQANLIGRGGFGDVYKGVLEDGIVAVKRLHSDKNNLDDKSFIREVDSLMNTRHQNIVLFAGYCAETQEEFMLHQGVKILLGRQERLLCFEYLHNGSLRKYISEKQPCELPWHVCYQIIKGICLGLNYLHARNIVHLDLKPENILLDDAMMPKIADFGLSRLLGEGKTHIITKSHIGTMGYMAPEYIDDGKITFMSDIYSLGVIIREMVMGRDNDATTDLDVPESWVIRVINDSSKLRQTKWEIGYQQIKACIEISHKCMETKPEDRPSMLDILNTLEEKEPVGPIPNDLLELPGFGPLAGDEGTTRNITKAPNRLDSITIRSGDVIDSIDFSYTDRDGQYHTMTRPWGGHGGADNNSFQLGPLEFLTGISGSVGPYCGLEKVITSLTFVTNARSYGPFGGGYGKPFHIQVQSDGCWIVGFFGRSSRYLHALGVYTNQEARVAGIGPWGENGRFLHGIIDRNEQQRTAGPSIGCGGDNFEFVKFGPWGGVGGSPRDIEKSPYRLHSITIRSGIIIDSIKFSYTDRDGEYHTTGAWGGHGGSHYSIELGPWEYLKGISGSTGDFSGLENVITSLTFVTNTRSYGPFGTGRGPHFHIPMLSNGCIAGFFGRSGLYLNAIGVYTNQELEIVGEDEVQIVGEDEGGVTRIGPWGADGGVLHDIVAKPYHLERVTIFSGNIIDSLEFAYSDYDGNQHIAGPWGGNGGAGRRIRFGPEEFIVEVSGTIHPWCHLPNAVHSLTLVTNTGTTYGPFGIELGVAFHIPVQSNSRIVGFFAHGEDYIEGIGAYIRTM